MSFLSRKSNPMEQRAQELDAEIARLEREIRKLGEPLPSRRPSILSGSPFRRSNSRDSKLVKTRSTERNSEPGARAFSSPASTQTHRSTSAPVNAPTFGTPASQAPAAAEKHLFRSSVGGRSAQTGSKAGSNASSKANPKTVPTHTLSSTAESISPITGRPSFPPKRGMWNTPLAENEIWNPATDSHFNPDGIRKFDLAGLVNRVMSQFRGPSPTSTGMATLLAAGSVQGLKPLRYEKRVARNRFIALFALLSVILLGLARVYLRQP